MGVPCREVGAEPRARALITVKREVAVKRRRFDRSIPFVLLLTLVGVAVLLVSLAHTGTNEAQGLPLPITIPSITLPIPQNPRVASTEPANGASNIPYDPIVSATFDKNMDPTTLSPASFYLKKSDGTPVPATVKYSTDLLGWYLYPQVTLDPGTTYVATLTAAAKGANGLVLWAAPVTWSFTTVSFTDVSLDDPTRSPSLISLLPPSSMGSLTTVSARATRSPASSSPR